MTEEIWAAIPSRPGYEASDQGRIRSVDRLITESTGKTRRHRGRVLRTTVLPNGYHHTFTGAGMGGYVHRLVLEAFVGPCPPGMEACHGIGGREDNRLTNLRWDTHLANVADTVRQGNKVEQRRTHCPSQHVLAAPNLVVSMLPNRKCMACNRGHARVAWLQSRGRPAVFRQIADAYYADIMAGTSAVAS
jgi:hypothetical protein